LQNKQGLLGARYIFLPYIYSNSLFIEEEIDVDKKKKGQCYLMEVKKREKIEIK